MRERRKEREKKLKRGSERERDEELERKRKRGSKKSTKDVC